MPLTGEERDSLLARYEVWGVDRVKAELERPDRKMFAQPEITSFACDWIEGQEKGRRGRRVVDLTLLAVGIGLLGAAASLGLIR